MSSHYVLAADIGGTHARFATFAVKGEDYCLCEKENFPTGALSFTECLDSFLDKVPDAKKVTRICVAAAGPVKNDAIHLINANLVITKKDIQKRLPQATVLLINDFLAQAAAVLVPSIEENLIALRQPRQPLNQARRIAVIGAGTGFGTAIITKKEKLAFDPTEFGHTAFPFDCRYGVDKILNRHFLRSDRPYAQLESVLSGAGLTLLHTLLTKEKTGPEVFTREKDFSKSVTCEAFARYYGRAARSVAFSFLPEAIVITGGVASKTPALVRHKAFLNDFMTTAPKYTPLFKAIDLRLNRQAQSGLFGAAYYALHYHEFL